MVWEYVMGVAMVWEYVMGVAMVWEYVMGVAMVWEYVMGVAMVWEYVRHLLEQHPVLAKGFKRDSPLCKRACILYGRSYCVGGHIVWEGILYRRAYCIGDGRSDVGAYCMGYILYTIVGAYC
jgi:hypothetical protein